MVNFLLILSVEHFRSLPCPQPLAILKNTLEHTHTRQLNLESLNTHKIHTQTQATAEP